jgi:hypothetical protein
MEETMKKILVLVACVFLIACASEGDQSKSEQVAVTAEDPHAGHAHAQKPAAVADMTVELATLNASCGCTLDEVGHCGNYVQIGTQYVALANSEDLGLGGMEWCGKEDVKVETAGEVKDGKFVATTLAVK